MMEEREIYLGPHPTKANGFSPAASLPWPSSFSTLLG
jgi:hypothetical protein